VVCAVVVGEWEWELGSTVLTLGMGNHWATVPLGPLGTGEQITQRSQVRVGHWLPHNVCPHGTTNDLIIHTQWRERSTGVTQT